MRKSKKISTEKSLISPGHRACAGCGQMISAIAASKGMGENVIITNATGCLEVTTTPYPESSWKCPWIHSLFENAAAVASGIRAALDYKNSHPPYAPPRAGGESGIPSGRREITSPPFQGGVRGGYDKIKVVAQGGDGATFDIGLGLLSGAWERSDDFLYICYDTEAYSNTGIQASGATPWGASTTTTPAGKNSLGSKQRKKDMIAIALAHGLKYIAQSTAGYPEDITAKVKKALTLGGPAYIQILTPCVPGWGIGSNEAIKLGKMAVQTGLYPLLEYINGELVNVSKIKNPQKVEDYLSAQKRFKHLFKSKEGKKQIKHIQNLANQNIKKYGLL